MSVVELLGQIDTVGADRHRGGYSRHGSDAAERELREWFTERACGRGVDVTADVCGNLWAWWGEPGPDAVVTGSHVDSVPSSGGSRLLTGVLSVELGRALRGPDG